MTVVRRHRERIRGSLHGPGRQYPARVARGSSTSRTSSRPCARHANRRRPCPSSGCPVVAGVLDHRRDCGGDQLRVQAWSATGGLPLANHGREPADSRLSDVVPGAGELLIGHRHLESRRGDGPLLPILSRLPTQLNSRIDERFPTTGNDSFDPAASRLRVQCTQYARVNPPSCSKFAPVM